jgi:4-amino-4-deoxy-L-arabinose transferase-like glycosyltransferase
MGEAAVVTDPTPNSTVTELAGPASTARRGAAVSPLVYILLAGVAVRALLWYGFRSEPLNVFDEREYHALAVNLLRYGEYTFTPGETPTSLRPPLYPALVAGIYSVAGEGNFAAVRLLQAAISLVTVMTAFWLGRVVAPRRVAYWQAGLLCFYPSLLVYNNLLLSEVLFTFLLTLACLLTVLGLQRCSIGLFAATGLVLGLAALTRSVVWLAPPFLAAFLLFVSRDSWTRRLAAAAALLCAFVLSIAPWAVRNTRVQGTIVAIDVMGGRNFMMGNYRYTPLYRSWDAISIEGERSWDQEIRATYPDDMRTTQGKIDKLALAQGLKFVRENPGLTLKRSIVKFFDFWGLERELSAGAGKGFYGQIPKLVFVGLTALIAGAYGAAIFLAFFGLVFAPPIDRRVHWLLVCVIAYVCGLHTIAFGHSRYHLPLMPLVLLYTAGAVTQARTIWARRRSLRFGFAVVLCAGLLAGWTWNFFAVDWQLFVDALQSKA